LTEQVFASTMALRMSVPDQSSESLDGPAWQIAQRCEQSPAVATDDILWFLEASGWALTTRPDGGDYLWAHPARGFHSVERVEALADALADYRSRANSWPAWCVPAWRRSR
jgi:hypothetical protein